MTEIVKLGPYFAGVLTVAVLGAVGVALFLMGSRGMSTREHPGALETWMARRARSLAMPAQSRDQQNPIPDTPEVQAEARAHWADHCAVCHSNNGSGEVEMGKRMYPPAPDMRLASTQSLTDGELFYIIENGIRLTGMPGWGGGAHHSGDDSWKLVRFIRHLPQLSADEEREMQALNPKSPDELREEQEERDFLNGAPTHEDEHEQHHHHH